MIKKKTITSLIVLLLILLIWKFYPVLDTKTEGFVINSDEVYVNYIVDGDTIKSNGTSIRLLGINTPEKGEEYYSDAKEFLSGLILNKSVVLEYGKDKTDLYGRTLAYVKYNGEIVNKKLIENGYANFYFPEGKDTHYKEFKESWERCLTENKNLCEKSKDICAVNNCIILNNFDYENEIITLRNSCSYECELTNWDIKDEGRKHFTFPNFVLKSNNEVSIIVGNGTNTENKLYWAGEKYVWTESGDSLFLRDSDGKLVLWEAY